METDGFREQLESLHAISVEIARLRNLELVYRRALGYCLELTESRIGFIGLLADPPNFLEVVAVGGDQPFDLNFYEQFWRMPVRASIFGVTLLEERPNVSNDALHDPRRVGQPERHPQIQTFLGVPLRAGATTIGMIGVGNRAGGYGPDQERLLGTFANQVAVAIENARLNEAQQEMIGGLRQLHDRLDESEREQLLTRERERIAAALHDHIEQSIFTIGIRLKVLLEGDLPPDVAEQLRALQELAAATDERVREVIFALAVPGQRADLTSSIRSLLAEMARGSDLQTDLVVTGTPGPGVAQVQDVVFNVVKEALTNVVKHAGARTALVSLRYNADQVHVTVQDDGRGAPELVLRRFPDSLLHFGLRHMREAVLAAGGTFAAANGDEGGLTIRVSVPLREASGPTGSGPP